MTSAMQAFGAGYARKDGSRVPVRLGLARRETKGDPGAGSLLDPVERRPAESRDSERRFREGQRELAHANRIAVMGQLTASIAHEVQQPIAATVTNAEAALRWLRRDPPDLDMAREALAAIARDGRRASDIIGRIRDHIRKAAPRKDLADINAAIQDVLGLTRGEATEHNVEIRTELADDLPRVFGDRVELQQVLVNLILNAIEAIRTAGAPSGQVVISTATTATGSVLVAVRDSGPGVARAAIDRIFDAFYTTKPAGLGMGLPICRSIVEAHGGRLWAGANHPRGAAFAFTMPAAPKLAPE